MNSTPTTTDITDITAKWRHVMVGAPVCPGGIRPVAIASTYAKSFTTAINGRPTRRGVPPH